MELRLYSGADRALTEALETDPEVMANLSGALSPEEATKTHRRRLKSVDADPWYFAIIPKRGGPTAGEIGLWDAEHEGEKIRETGWMVLPVYQGRGIASAALGELVARAKAAGALEPIHAFPSVGNAPSNALCRKHGFELLGEYDTEYRGKPLRCNHWVLDPAAR